MKNNDLCDVNMSQFEFLKPKYKLNDARHVQIQGVTLKSKVCVMKYSMRDIYSNDGPVVFPSNGDTPDLSS